MPDFTLKKEDSKSKARLGRLSLAHGEVDTPVFMPVGTYGTVRGISTEDLESTGSQIMLCNTFHMVCRPGVEIIENSGGLHSFNTWKRPILTDSGGFQVFSLAQHRKLSEEGVQFKDPFSGDAHFFTPEKVVGFQESFGSDVMMVLDECPAANAPKEVIEAAVARTTDWARRSREAHQKKQLALFPIIQGACDIELRKKSLQDILDLERSKDAWNGIAVGGLSVGESKADFIRTLYGIRSCLPTDRPRYLMGVGTPRDLVFGVACGIDMFDCVIPSRNARHGIVMTSEGKLNLRNSQFRDDFRPLDAASSCEMSRRYSRSYIRHLFQIGEALGPRIATIHNLHYFLDLMATIRKHLAEDTFFEFAYQFLREPATEYLGKDSGDHSYPEEF